MSFLKNKFFDRQFLIWTLREKIGMEILIMSKSQMSVSVTGMEGEDPLWFAIRSHGFVQS